ncbi:unnamed protein product [Effrenium voratum]|nr:unnamed protein product [Effrenium voratum]
MQVFRNFRLRLGRRRWPFFLLLCSLVAVRPCWLGSEGSSLRGRRGAFLAAATSLVGSEGAQALVKGNAPPKEDYGLGKGLKTIGPADCRSRVECEELGRQREEESSTAKAAPQRRGPSRSQRAEPDTRT